MEELITNNGQINPKQLFSVPNSNIYSLYAYSSRFIAMPQKQKQKCPEGSCEQIVTVNEPYYEQVKGRIQDQYCDLNSYIGQLEQKIQKMNCDQINWLGDKYRYYLRKFKKYSSEHQKYSQSYNNLQTTVIQSLPVQQEMKSIDFIKMISAQTDKKLLSLKQTVKLAQEQKNLNQKNIQRLRQQLNLIKTQYFSKKRQQGQLMKAINDSINQKKMRQIQYTMSKIRQQKRNKLQEAKRQYSNIFSTARHQHAKQNTFHLMTQNKFNSAIDLKPFLNNCSNTDTTLKELKNINIMNQKYIKTLSQTCQNFKNRQLQEKKKINSKMVSQIDLQNYRQKSRQQNRIRKSEQQQLMTNEQIIKQLSITNRMKDQFNSKKSEQIMNILIQSKKVKELFKIIQEVKNNQKKRSIIQNRKVNMIRSQIYKNNSSLIVTNDFQNSISRQQ